MHEILVNSLGGLSLPRKSAVRLTDRPDMTLDVYRGHKTPMQKLAYMAGKKENGQTTRKKKETAESQSNNKSFSFSRLKYEDLAFLVVENFCRKFCPKSVAEL